jgi:hypothetical protein
MKTEDIALGFFVGLLVGVSIGILSITIIRTTVFKKTHSSDETINRTIIVDNY